MRLATWNVNSIRARVDRIVDFAVRRVVDVLAMQEIKCKAEQFPFEQFEDAGYHVEAHGFSQWNGVAIAEPRAARPTCEHAFPGMPGFAKEPRRCAMPRRRPARSARPSAASGCGASTCPTAARSATRTTTTSSTGSRALQRVHARRAGREPRSRARARRRLQHRPDGCRQRRPRGGPGLLDPRLAARARGVRGARGGGADGRRAPARADRIHVLGLQAAALPEATRACASTSSSARTRSRTPSPARRSTATSARAKLPSDHVPVVVDLDLDGARRGRRSPDDLRLKRARRRSRAGSDSATVWRTRRRPRRDGRAIREAPPWPVLVPEGSPSSPSSPGSRAPSTSSPASCCSSRRSWRPMRCGSGWSSSLLGIITIVVSIGLLRGRRGARIVRHGRLRAEPDLGGVRDLLPAGAGVVRASCRAWSC